MHFNLLENNNFFVYQTNYYLVISNVKNTMKIKIVYVITGLGMGGAEMMLYKILSRIDREKFSPIIVSLIDSGVFGDRFVALDIDVHTINMQQGIPTPWALWRLKNLLLELKPDLIQGWMYHGGLAAQVANLLSFSPVPICWSIHHSVDSLAAEKISLATVIKLCAIVSKYTDKVVFSSQKSRSQHEKLGYYPPKSLLIHDSFDTLTYKPLATARTTLITELNLSADSIIIGLVARYHPMKDHANFLQAAALIAQDYPQAHFILVGTNVDSQNQELSALIKSLNLEQQTHLLGLRYDVPVLIAGLDIFTVSSAFGESFPNVIGEAMSCEVPCVVTDVGDSALIVGDVGKVVPAKNALALANGWREILALDLKDRKALGKQARARILQYFSLNSPNSATVNYENLYKDILEDAT